MKKLCGILILCLMMLSLSAMAETQDSWNDGSDWRLNAETPVWNMVSEARDGGEYVFMLPKGTWVRVLVQDGDWTVIDYFAGGVIRSGAVASDAVYPVNGMATVEPTPVPTPIPLATAVPSIAQPAETPKPAGTLPSMLQPADTEAAEALSESTPVPVQKFTVTVPYQGETVTASVLTLGSHTSLVEGEDGEFTVPTNQIVCSDAVPAGHQIAVITARKTGTASLRAEASAKAENLAKLRDGTLVCVLSEGKDFCKIWVNGMTGFVNANVLEYDVYVAEPVGTALLKGSNGKTTGSGTVNVRVTNKKTAAKSDEWPVGTEVLVLKSVKDWYLVELNGQRGYINKAYIKLNN